MAYDSFLRKIETEWAFPLFLCVFCFVLFCLFVFFWLAFMAYDSFLRKIETEWVFPLFFLLSWLMTFFRKTETE